MLFRDSLVGKEKWVVQKFKQLLGLILKYWN